MSFQWPEFLWLLAGLPALVALYVYLLRRRKKFAVRFSSLALVRDAMGAPSWRRHVPPLLVLLALAALIVAVARPSALMTLPSQHEVVILAMDVSGSMRASDVEPNRLVAAQAAAKTFIADQPDHVKIGIVAFAGTATVAQAPTNNKEDLYAAIDRFQLQRATAIGSAIIVSLATLFPVGVGTPEGKIVGFDGWSMHVRLDEDTLRAIADLTRGEYFYAGNALDLKKIYQSMNSRLVMETKKTEIGAFFSAAAAALVLLAGILSLAWFNRIL